MKVAMMQPTFLPWMGFFELIYQSDCFIFLDDFQFSPQSYHQRNRLFTNLNQVGWYTIPVLKSFALERGLNEVIINDSVIWRRKMINRLRHNYTKSLFFNDIFPVVEKCLNAQVASLADFNLIFIHSVIELFGWKKEFRFSSDFQADSMRSERVLELLRWCDATQYYSARGSFGYMQADGVFPVDNLELLFQNFLPVSYPQVGSLDTFVPYLSTLDALFNIGPAETEKLVISGTHCWHKWNEMECMIYEDQNERIENVGT
jgi:hypothetical protein